MLSAAQARVMRTRWNSGRNATDRYRELVNARATPGSRILHAGCGWDRSAITGPLRDVCRITGIDLDPRVGPLFHSPFVLGSLAALPHPAASFDLVVSEYVLEHVAEPDAMLHEIARVLRPGGHFLCLTPNALSYKALAARLTPQRVHEWWGRKRYGPGHEQDMYETLYRCNTAPAVRRAIGAAGMQLTRLEYVNNGPTWFEKVPGVFQVFDAVHRAMDTRPAAPTRCALIFEAERPE